MMMPIAIVTGYLIGSIPFALILSKQWGVDLRRTGSGNLGAANVMRASGITPGVLVAALDVAKGAASVWLAERLSVSDQLARQGGRGPGRHHRTTFIRCGCVSAAARAWRPLAACFSS